MFACSAGASWGAKGRMETMDARYKYINKGAIEFTRVGLLPLAQL